MKKILLKHLPSYILPVCALLTVFFLTPSCVTVGLDAVSGSTLIWNSGSNNYFNREAYTTLQGPKKLVIDGEVEQATEIKLSKFPLRTVTVKEAMYCKEGDSIAFLGAFRYEGYALCDILSAVKVDKESKEDLWPPIDLYIEVRNDAGDTAVFSWGTVLYGQHVRCSSGQKGHTRNSRKNRRIVGPAHSNETDCNHRPGLCQEHSVSHTHYHPLTQRKLHSGQGSGSTGKRPRAPGHSNVFARYRRRTDITSQRPSHTHVPRTLRQQYGYKGMREYSGLMLRDVWLLVSC